MRILIVNPNSDKDMTTKIQHFAEDFAQDRFQVLCRPVENAPKFIDTYVDQASIAAGMMQLVQSSKDEFDAFVIACHSDPNLDAIKEMIDKPVVGIGEASMKIASMLGHSFSVISTDKHSIPAKLALA